MKVIHYGEDYCKVLIGTKEYEEPIVIGKGIDLLTKKLESQRAKTSELKEKLIQVSETLLGDSLEDKKRISSDL